jgi:hypothetical protein
MVVGDKRGLALFAHTHTWNYYVADHYVRYPGSLIAFCTSSLSITALCKLDLIFLFFVLVGLDFGAGGSIGVASMEGDPVSRRWIGTIIGVVRGGGGHL